jgi:hypothetical protein
MKKILAVAVVALLGTLAAVSSLHADPLKDGPEFLVSEYTLGYQDYPRVAMHSSGSFVVVWHDIGRDGDYYGIFARLYDSAGQATGGSFMVNTSTLDYQRLPAVAMDDAGNFVVVWDDYGQDGDGYGIVGQRFDSAGNMLGGEFVVNSTTALWQRIPDIAMDPAGNFVVVWESGYFPDPNISYDVFGQLFDSSGTAVGGEFQVNTYATDHQEYPRVAMDPFGEFIVVWESDGQDLSGDGIFMQLFDSTAAAVGGEFQVNTNSTFNQLFPVAMKDDLGNFVVAWDSAVQDGSAAGVFMRRFDSTGYPITDDLQVNSYTTYYQVLPSISHDGDGGFVVVWNSYDQDRSYNGVFGQAFDSNGVAVDKEFQVNTYTPYDQLFPAVGVNDAGDFVVVWSSYYQDGDYTGIYGQRFFSLGDIIITSPTDGSTLDCSDPALSRPTFTWTPGRFERYKVFVGYDPTFVKGTRVTSGKTLLKTRTWTPGKKKWRKACKKALAGSLFNPVLYIQIMGRDTDLRKRDPARTSYSDTVQVDARFF